MTGTSTSAGWLEVDARILTGDAGTGIGVGQPFFLTIEARHPPGGIALLPEEVKLGDALGERTGRRSHERKTEAGVEIDQYRLELIAFDSGEVTVPSIPLALGSTTAETAPIALVVESGFSEDELKVASSTLPQAIPELESMAAADPQPEKIRGPDYTLFWVIGGLALAGLLWLALRRLARRASVKPAPPPPPPRPAHEIARERLMAIAPLVEDEDLKPFFIELSEVLREYAGGRYGFDSLELTIDELMQKLEAKNTSGLDVARLQAVLTRADLVKFAKYKADVEEARQGLSDALAIVEATIPREDAA